MKRVLLTILLSLFAVCGLADDVSRYRNINICGYLKDVFSDPTDPSYYFLYVQTSSESYYVAMSKTNTPSMTSMEQSIGAQLNISGRLFKFNCLPRIYSPNEIRVKKPVVSIVVHSPAPADMFDFPDVEALLRLTPDCISTQGFHCARGMVLAAFDSDHVMIRTPHGRIVDAFVRSDTLPRVGSTIDVTGLPETTLYSLRLNRAIWRESSSPCTNSQPTAVEDPHDLFTYGSKSHISLRRHGELFRLTGILRSIQSENSKVEMLYVEDRDRIFPVDVSAALLTSDDLQIGCTLEVTGICSIDAEVWRPNAVFPRIRGYTLITRSPTDIRVVASPPWLTPSRAIFLVGALLAVLVGVLVWNNALRVQSERRGRQLAEEQIMRAESDLKVHERTRLAVELHDALSQSLAGVALELKTVAVLADDNPELAKTHLEVADRSLLSCRDDLRNCLHDLRSNALEEPTMDLAIMKTLSHFVDTTGISIRFNVSRELLSDNTTHAILCIIRELTMNAIRHGQATAVKIAGTIDGGKLLVSVRDNGKGFDVENHPGVGQGHFGLQGIQERIMTFDGSFTISSAPGRGTKAAFSLNLPKSSLQNG